MTTVSKQAKRAFSKKTDPKEAIQELKEQFGNLDGYKIIFFFASVIYSADKLSKEFKSAFPDIIHVGSSTCGELITGKVMHDSIVAIALDDTIIKKVSIGVVEDVNDVYQVDSALNKIKADIGAEKVHMNPDKYVGLIFANGLTNKEESLISRLNDLTEVMFVGGSAGDSWNLKETYLYYNGKYYTKSAILVLIEPKVGFKVLKSQSFVPIGKVAKITQSDTSTRCIKTIDNIPAGVFYSKQAGIPVDRIKDFFNNYAIGITIYNEAYLHDVKSMDDEYNLYMYSSVPKDAEMQVLKAINIAQDMKLFRERELMTLPSISAILHFCCASRFEKIKQEEEGKDFKQTFEGLPSIGFATYGEFFTSFINQTSVLLVLY